jgi:shikimate dehydrogenase
LNVTIPLKEKVIEFVELDPLAERVGAVNTIDLRTNIGYNTDAAGIKMALEDEGININGKKLLLLGAGGAARAIAFQMKEDGADITIANRTGRRAIDLAREVGTASIGLDGIASVIGDMDILINATSVGMCPDVESTLVTADMMHRSMIIFDIIYNPAETKLLREAKKAGAKAIGGVTMLVHQGAESFKIWTSKEAPLDVMEAAVRERMVG